MLVAALLVIAKTTKKNTNVYQLRNGWINNGIFILQNRIIENS